MDTSKLAVSTVKPTPNRNASVTFSIKNIDSTEIDFLNLSFEALTQACVKVQFSIDNKIKITQKEAGVVKSTANFLNMSFEQLVRIPVRIATVGTQQQENDKKNQKKKSLAAVRILPPPLCLVINLLSSLM